MYRFFIAIDLIYDNNIDDEFLWLLIVVFFLHATTARHAFLKPFTKKTIKFIQQFVNLSSS